MRPGRLVAAMVIVALAGGAVYVAGVDGAPLPAPAMSDTVSTSTATSRPRPVASTAAAPTPPLLSTAAPSSLRDHFTVVSDGLAAWGRFAVTGDLDTVAPWFSGEGPQWERFTSEAPDLAADPLGDPPYRVMVEASDMTGDAGEMRVDARVRFVRTGEPSQTFRWQIVLREEADGWRIWTVEEADSYSSTSSIGNP